MSGISTLMSLLVADVRRKAGSPILSVGRQRHFMDLSEYIENVCHVSIKYLCSFCTISELNYTIDKDLSRRLK